MATDANPWRISPRPRRERAKTNIKGPVIAGA